MKKIKVMAYIMSSGLWDGLGPISLEKLIGVTDDELERDLTRWHASYDDQFKRYPHDFDWDSFNRVGEELTGRIKAHLAPDTEIIYEPSDDREFFARQDCSRTRLPRSAHDRELSLRQRKQSLLYRTPTILRF